MTWILTLVDTGSPVARKSKGAENITGGVIRLAYRNHTGSLVLPGYEHSYLHSTGDWLHQTALVHSDIYAVCWWSRVYRPSKMPSAELSQIRLRLQVVMFSIEG